MKFRNWLRETEKLDEEVPTINTTSVGNSSTEGGSANFAPKMDGKKGPFGPKKKKKKKKKKEDED